MTLHIAWTRYSQTRARVVLCPVCGVRRRQCCQFQDWYGWTVTCTDCGSEWADGEMRRKPFASGWKENAADARKALRLEYQKRAARRRGRRGK